MIYLVCFAASVFLAHLAYRVKKGGVFLFFSVLSILTTVMLAGLRDYSIGTDVENYMTLRQFWDGAINSKSLGDYLRLYFSMNLTEPLFALFIGMIAQFVGDYRLFLLLSHLVIVTAIYVGAFRMKHHARPELVLLLFYLLYYNNSLNIIRQYMAMAVVFAFLVELENRRFGRYIMAVLIAMLIHNTAIISFVPLIIYLVLYPKKETVAPPAVRMFWICGVILVGVYFFIPLVNLAIRWGVLNSKFDYYFQDETSKLAITRLLIRILEVVGLLICYQKIRRKNQYLEFYVVNTVTFLALLEMSRSIAHGQRIPVHFAFSNIVMVSMMESCHKKSNVRLVWAAMIISLSAYYWFHTYVLGGASETIPYQFGI